MNTWYKRLAVFLTVAFVATLASVNWNQSVMAQGLDPVDLEIGLVLPEENYVNEVVTATIIMTNTSVFTVEIFANFQVKGVMNQGGDYAKGYEFFFAPSMTITETVVFTPEQVGEFEIVANIAQVGQKQDTDPSDNVVETTLLVDVRTEIPIEPTVDMTFEEPVLKGVTETFTVTVRLVQEPAKVVVHFFCFNADVPEQVFDFSIPIGNSVNLIEFKPANICVYELYATVYGDRNRILAQTMEVFKSLDPLGPGPDPLRRLMLPAMHR